MVRRDPLAGQAAAGRAHQHRAVEAHGVEEADQVVDQRADAEAALGPRHRRVAALRGSQGVDARRQGGQEGLEVAPGLHDGVHEHHRRVGVRIAGLGVGQARPGGERGFPQPDAAWLWLRTAVHAVSIRRSATVVAPCGREEWGSRGLECRHDELRR